MTLYEFAVFQISNQTLRFVAQFKTENQAIEFARTGTNMIVLKVYL